ncbi:MAG TPA: DUF1573 domain-containing protein [Flavobacteriales bacterium]|jgi:hypothetical protein|nr:DUF1573 domain-containing protein [Flavobacteriales bacterium]
MSVKSIFFTVGVLLLTSCESSDKPVSAELVKNPSTANAPNEKSELPIMEFEENTLDFGSIVQGEVVERTYKFKNSGKIDLIISSADASCGCTVPDWPRTPIKPGESGEIKVVFKSEGKKGHQNKKIYLVANTMPSQNVINLTGEVIAPETE